MSKDIVIKKRDASKEAMQSQDHERGTSVKKNKSKSDRIHGMGQDLVKEVKRFEDNRCSMNSNEDYLKNDIRSTIVNVKAKQATKNRGGELSTILNRNSLQTNLQKVANTNSKKADPRKTDLSNQMQQANQKLIITNLSLGQIGNIKEIRQDLDHKFVKIKKIISKECTEHPERGINFSSTRLTALSSAGVKSLRKSCEKTVRDSQEGFKAAMVFKNSTLSKSLAVGSFSKKKVASQVSKLSKRSAKRHRLVTNVDETTGAPGASFSNIHKPTSKVIQSQSNSSPKAAIYNSQLN